MLGQTDGQTDTVPLHRPCSVYCESSSDNKVPSSISLYTSQWQVIRDVRGNEIGNVNELTGMGILQAIPAHLYR